MTIAVKITLQEGAWNKDEMMPRVRVMTEPYGRFTKPLCLHELTPRDPEVSITILKDQDIFLTVSEYTDQLLNK